MEIGRDFVWLLLGTAVVTLLPRVVPLALLSRIPIPDMMLRYLRHIPVAVMAALLAQAILTADGQLIPIERNINLLALIPTLVAALITRSLLTTVMTGVASMMLIRLLIL